jgi:hypothetical protein
VSASAWRTEQARFAGPVFVLATATKPAKLLRATRSDGEAAVMKSLMATVLVAATLMLSGLAAITSASAAPRAKTQAAGISDATDFGAHRHYRRHHRHYGYHRPHGRPYYYGRPTYYRPYPYQTPAPFTFGIGFGPSWWWARIPARHFAFIFAAGAFMTRSRGWL